MMKKLMMVMMPKTPMYRKILFLYWMEISTQTILSLLMLTQCFLKICSAILLFGSKFLQLAILFFLYNTFLRN